MSLHYDASVFATGIRQQYSGDQCVVLRTGAVFTAEIQTIQDIELNTMLNRDARESCTFHILDRIAASGINEGDKIASGGVVYLVLRRSDNPINPQVDFGLMKFTNKDS